MRWAPPAVIVPPAEEPVTLAEAKLHLRVDMADNDALITTLITGARQFCEEFQNRAYVTQKLRLKLPRWPRGRSIALPRPPLISVESVSYIPDGGAPTVLDSGLYIVETSDEPGRILLATGAEWPSVPLQPGMPIAIDYTAGYGNAAAVPVLARQAMLLWIGMRYENRGEGDQPAKAEQITMDAIRKLLSLNEFRYAGPDGYDA